MLSGILHAALYPASLIPIAIGFWKLGLWHGLAMMLLISIAAVALKFVLVGGFGILIAALDPSFFQ